MPRSNAPGYRVVVGDREHDSAQSTTGQREHEQNEPVKDIPRVLLWCNYDPYNAAMVCDHINALSNNSRFDVTVLSQMGSIPDSIDLDTFDAIVIHYSLTIALTSYVSAKARHRLVRYRGPKVLFIQDEYRFVERTRESIRQLGISLVFTCVPPNELPKVYPPKALPGVEFVNVLTGYVPAWLTVYPPKPLRERTIDVGYRGREYPAWHGRVGREKVQIGQRFRRDAGRFGLRCDIRWRERDRLYGARWRCFLQNCRATLAVESGASVFDFDGRIGPRTETFEKLLGTAADYETVRRRFFEGVEDRIDFSQISPRVFEATAIRTLLIMYEGHYSGVLTPWVHYLPLKKDHSNMGEVVAALRDDIRVGEIIANAFADIAMDEHWSFARFVQFFDDHLEKHLHFDPERPSRQARIDKIRNEHRAYLVDNPHEMSHQSRTRVRMRQALALLLRSWR